MSLMQAVIIAELWPDRWQNAAGNSGCSAVDTVSRQLLAAYGLIITEYRKCEAYLSLVHTPGTFDLN